MPGTGAVKTSPLKGLWVSSSSVPTATPQQGSLGGNDSPFLSSHSCLSRAAPCPVPCRLINIRASPREMAHPGGRNRVGVAKWATTRPPFFLTCCLKTP